MDRERYYRYGPKSNVSAPIRVGGIVIGAISFASLREERSWPPELVQKFVAAGEIFGFGLECKRMETEMLRARSELSYVSRLTTTSELAGSMAHELNDPLTAILNNAEALRATLASDQPDIEEVKVGISDIIQDNNRARQKIQRVRALFRRDVVTKSELDVSELAGETARLVRNDALIRKLSIAVDVEHPIPRIFADRVQIQQAIVNLVSNAFHAVAGNDDEPRDVRIEARARDEGRNVQILVRDSGRGVEPEALPKILMFSLLLNRKARAWGWRSQNRSWKPMAVGYLFCPVADEGQRSRSCSQAWRPQERIDTCALGWFSAGVWWR